jgi:hypothetical protein
MSGPPADSARARSEDVRAIEPAAEGLRVAVVAALGEDRAVELAPDLLDLARAIVIVMAAGREPVFERAGPMDG